jgi:DNA polymerase
MIVHNCVQAIARDCLAETLLAVNQGFFDIVAHVHDEIVVELPCETAEKDFEVIKKVMGSELSWAKGLPLTADGYLTKFYKKD